MLVQDASQIPVVVGAIDSRGASLLLEFYDHERLYLDMAWLRFLRCIPQRCTSRPGSGEGSREALLRLRRQDLRDLRVADPPEVHIRHPLQPPGRHRDHETGLQPRGGLVYY